MRTSIPGFRPVPRTGVIYVMHEAEKHGFTYDDPEWANLGQGSPETGPIPGAPPRVERVTIAARDQAYAPIQGDRALRQAVADYYNFDVNPDNRRAHGRYQGYSRISFGPDAATVERGLDALERTIGRFT